MKFEVSFAIFEGPVLPGKAPTLSSLTSNMKQTVEAPGPGPAAAMIKSAYGAGCHVYGATPKG